MRLCWASEKGLVFCFKSEYEGIFVVVAVSFTSKAKIEGERKLAILKRAMTENISGWSSKGWQTRSG